MYKLLLIDKKKKNNTKNILKMIENNIEIFNFTDREYDVVNYVIKGKSNDEISDLLYISPETVKKHLYSVYKKTAVNNRTELLAKLIDLI